MLFNPYLAQRLAEEYIKDRRHEAEQERLFRALKEAKREREGRQHRMKPFGSLAGLMSLKPRRRSPSPAD